MSNKKPTAIVIKSAVCVGKGTDRYKRVNGMTKNIREKAASIDPDAIYIVPSNTCWKAQLYKEAYSYGGRWCHRFVWVDDYEIIGEVSE